MRADRPPLVVAVVPLFRPSERQLAALTSLGTQVDHVVAVDDGSTVAFDLSDAEDITFVRLTENRGIARCLNVGIREALRHGATHVLTLDQDSQLPAAYVRTALETLDRLDAEGVAIGGIGAGLIGPHLVEGAELVEDVRDGTDGIQSGWLLPRTTLDRVGQFDEGLFIDCVDVDYLMRAALADLPIGVTSACAIEHALGADEHVIRLFGRSVVFSSHPPFRRYYITRNRITMVRRYGARRPRAMLGQALAAARITLLCLVFDRSRRAQAAAVWAGAVHGLAGREGRIPSRTMRRLSRAA